MNALLCRVFIWLSRTRHMILDLVLAYCIHESLRLRSRLNWRIIESQSLGCTKIADELCQRIADTVAIHFLDGIGNLKPAFITAQGLYLAEGSIRCKLSFNCLTLNSWSALYRQLMGNIADRTPRWVVTRSVLWACKGPIPKRSATNSAVTFAYRSSLTKVRRAGASSWS